MPQPLSPTPRALPTDPTERQRFSKATSRPVADAPADPKLKTACDEMEALFIHHLLGEMRKTVGKSGLVDGGRAEEIYTSLMDAELAKQMAASGALGLSKMLLEQMRASAAAPAKKIPGR